MPRVLSFTKFAAASLLGTILAFGSLEASAQSIRILAEHDEPSGSTIDQLLHDMAKELAEKTDGRIELVPNAAASLSGGNIRTMIQNAQSGAVQMSMIATSIYTSFDPRMNVFSLPFLVANIDKLEELGRNSDLAKELYADQSERGLHIADAWTRALRQIVNNEREVKTVDDLEGLRFRVPEIELWADAFRAAGASPIAMPFSEIPVAMETNAIDGAERPTAFLESEQWWTMADYVTMANYTGDLVMVAFNQTFWEGLSKEDQELLTSMVRKYGDMNHQREKKGEEEVIATLKEHGMTVTQLTEESQAGFQEVMKDVWASYEDEIGEDVVERAVEVVQ